MIENAEKLKNEKGQMAAYKLLEETVKEDSKNNAKIGLLIEQDVINDPDENKLIETVKKLSQVEEAEILQKMNDNLNDLQKNDAVDQKISSILTKKLFTLKPSLKISIEDKSRLMFKNKKGTIITREIE